MSRVAVVGPGAIGTYFAAHLLETGRHDVVVCARRPFDELLLESGGRTIRHRPAVLTDPARAHPVDWVLLATKAHQTGAVRAWLERLVGPETTVVVLQNGIDHEDRVHRIVPSARVVPTVVYCGAEKLAPGHVVHRTNGFLIVPEGNEAAPLVELFAGSDAEIRPSTHFLESLWQKLSANVVANGMTALTARRMEVFRQPDLAEQARRLARECQAVARAEGAEIDDHYADALVEGMAAMPDDAGTSMLYDRLAGRPLEHDALHGAVVRAARRHGIATPVLDTVAALLAALSAPAPTDGDVT